MRGVVFHLRSSHRFLSRCGLVFDRRPRNAPPSARQKFWTIYNALGAGAAVVRCLPCITPVSRYKCRQDKDKLMGTYIPYDDGSEPAKRRLEQKAD